MRESHEDIVTSWLETLCKDAGECTISPALNPENLSKILAGLEMFIVDKDTAKLNAMLTDIKEDLEYEITHLNQLRLAMFLFQDTINPILRKQQIKPHWMFALDNLIRSAVQAAVGAISPDLAAQLSSEEALPKATTQVDLTDLAGQTQSIDGRRGGGVSNEILDGATVNLRKDLVSVVEQNQKLLEELVNVQKAYQELIQLSIRENRLRFEQLRDQLQSNPVRPALDGEGIVSFPVIAVNSNTVPISLPPSLGHSALGMSLSPPQAMLNGSILSSAATSPPVLEAPISLAAGDPALISWLNELNVDAHSIDVLARRQEYTKDDLLEFVSREDLMHAGLRGGIVCRIWRAIQQNRKRPHQPSHQPHRVSVALPINRPGNSHPIASGDPVIGSPPRVMFNLNGTLTQPGK